MLSELWGSPSSRSSETRPRVIWVKPLPLAMPWQRLNLIDGLAAYRISQYRARKAQAFAIAAGIV